MTEQGLKAVVYPELDEQGMATFIQQITTMLGNTSIPIGIETSTQSSSGSTSTSSGDKATPKVEIDPDKVGKGVSQGMKETADDDDTTNKFHMPTKLSLTSILTSLGGVAGAVGVGAVGVATATVGIFKFLESASPPLKNVMDLFGQAFNLIWMPIGTLLAVQLMPFLVKTFSRVGEWVSEAMTVYEEGGWTALIHEAVSTSLDVLCELLLSPDLWTILGTIVWELFTRFSWGNLLSELIFGEPASWTDISNIVSGIQKYWDWITGVWKDIFNFVGDIVDKVKSFLKPLVNFFLNLTPVKLITDLVNKLINNLLTGLGKLLADIIPNAKAVGDGVKNFINNTFGTNFAEGGVVTQPTYGLFGEAGPEAVIPLNRFSQVANEYITNTNNTGGNIAGGGNVMNFYINGNNAQDIGEEVQRILEKTVGKASSKMMWW